MLLNMLKDKLGLIVENLTYETKSFYEDRLVSLAIFGSVGRGTPNCDSDIDLLIIADNLPNGRMKRISEFNYIENKIEPVTQSLKNYNINTRLSPVIKSKEEALYGSPLFLDMVSDAVILYDRDNFLTDILNSLKIKLEKLGSKKIIRGNACFWDLKPDLKQGEDIII